MRHSEREEEGASGEEDVIQRDHTYSWYKDDINGPPPHDHPDIMTAYSRTKAAAAAEQT